MSRKAIDARAGVAVSIDPATLETLGELTLADEAGVRAVAAAADRAFPAWAALPIEARAARLAAAREALLDRLEEACALVSREVGKPRLDALRADLVPALDALAACARGRPDPLAGTERRTLRPLGAVAVLAPWTEPLGAALPVVAPALLAGNTVVFKPASDAVLTGILLGEVMEAAGLPPGVFTCVPCAGDEAGRALCEPPIRKIFLAGAPATASAVLRAASVHRVPVVAAVPAPGAMVVREDADLDRAAAAAVWAAFAQAGQTAGAIGRAWVARAVHDRLAERVVRRTRALRLGPGLDPEVDVGPLVAARRVEAIDARVRDALARGGRLLAGGRRVPDRDGWFYEPAVLVDADPSMQAMNDEALGPVLALCPYDAEDEAAARLATPQGAGGLSVWTRDAAAAGRLARRIPAAAFAVNDLPPWHGGWDDAPVACAGPGPGAYARATLQGHGHGLALPGLTRRGFPYSRAAWELRRLAVLARADARDLGRLISAVSMRTDTWKALF